MFTTVFTKTTKTTHKRTVFMCKHIAEFSGENIKWRCRKLVFCFEGLVEILSLFYFIQRWRNDGAVDWTSEGCRFESYPLGYGTRCSYLLMKQYTLNVFYTPRQLLLNGRTAPSHPHKVVKLWSAQRFSIRASSKTVIQQTFNLWMWVQLPPGSFILNGVWHIG